MAEYLLIENYSKKGKMGISLKTFDSLVVSALANIPEISQSQTHLKKNQKIRLNRPVQTSISRGILHVSLKIDVKKNTNIQEITRKIHKEITNVIVAATEQVPFDIQVKVISMF